jgi:hypothetical protein
MTLQHSVAGSGLADILERILDKGIVVAGDISISLVGVELLTVRIRLVVASVDRALEMGIRWWESDAALTGAPAGPPLGDAPPGGHPRGGHPRGERARTDTEALLERVARLEHALAVASGAPV